MGKLIIKNKYAQVPNSLLENKLVTLRAKGVYAYIQSRPDDWDFSIEKIAFSTGETPYKIKYSLQELSKAGYLERHKFTKGRGHFDIEYILYDQPNLSSVGTSTDDVSFDDVSSDDTPTDINKNGFNKKDINKKDESKSLQLSPSNSFSNLPDNNNSLSVGTKDLPSPSPSNTPLPPDIKILGGKMFDLLRSKMRSEMDDILSRTELDLPTLSEMFAEYWVYNKGRDFDPKNHKGITSSFQKWFEVGGSKELPTKEISNGIKGKTIMEEIIEIVRKKKGIEMTSDEATSVKKFLAETILTDDQLKMEVTRRFLMGGGTTWKTWLSIAANVHSEEMYHRRLNGKV